MMKRLTKGQQRELAVVRHFTPLGYPEPSDADVSAFFAWSDRGVGRDVVVAAGLTEVSGLAGLYWGKRHRDLMVTSYRADWGLTCFAADFDTEPAEVRNFVLARVA